MPEPEQSGPRWQVICSPVNAELLRQLQRQAAKLDGWLLNVGTLPRRDYMLTFIVPPLGMVAFKRKA